MPASKQIKDNGASHKLLLCLALLAAHLTMPPASRSGQVEISVAGPAGPNASPLLIGMNAVYSHEKAETWTDGSKIQALRDAGVCCLRYPGGHVVSFWDWEFPYHSAYQNFWDPTYIKSLDSERRADLEQQNGSRMLLDDFFRICTQARTEPIVGINMFQGYKFNRTEDSVAKAVRLVKHCMEQKPGVKYYYLDNEAGHHPDKENHIPVNDYIELIPVYSRAIKKVQPEAKLIVNPIGWNRVGEMIRKSGRHFDIVDIHWYYNNREWGLFYIDDWRKERGNRKFERAVTEFRKSKEQAGCGHLKLASLEWNLGPASGKSGSDTGSALFAGLVQADMLMTFIYSDLAMAATWPMTWVSRKNPGSGGFRNFLDQETGEASPSRHIFRWFSLAADGRPLQTNITTPEGLRSACILSKDGKTMLVYILNKSREDKDVTILFNDPVASASAKSFEEGKSVNDVVLRDVPTMVAEKTVRLEMTDTSFIFLEAAVR